MTLKDKGYGPTAIYVKIKIPRSTISSFLICHARSGNSTLISKPRSGRPRKITPRGERALVRTAISEPRITLKALGSPSKSGKQLNHHMVAKVLKRHGKAKRRPRRKPYLSVLHKKKRKAHCKSELALKRNPWRVYWSNKVTFWIGEDGTIFYVTRGTGREEEYTDKNLRPSFKSGRVSVGAWASFCGDELELIYILLKGENMTAKCYY